jgi:hypothetical protein
MKCLVGLLLAAWLVPAWSGFAQSSARPRIVRVEKMDPDIVQQRNFPKLTHWSRDKFSDLRGGLEMYEIRWEAPRGGLEGGVVLLFEYRRESDKAIRNQTRKYASPVYGTRETTFVIPGRNIYEDGPVTWWRVRLTRQGRVLAEQSSDSGR